MEGIQNNSNQNGNEAKLPQSPKRKRKAPISVWRFLAVATHTKSLINTIPEREWSTRQEASPPTRPTSDDLLLVSRYLWCLHTHTHTHTTASRPRQQTHPPFLKDKTQIRCLRLQHNTQARARHFPFPSLLYSVVLLVQDGGKTPYLQTASLKGIPERCHAAR